MLNKLKVIIKTIFENKLFLIFVFGLVAGIIILFLGRIRIPKSEKPELGSPDVYNVKPENRVNTWNGITPGKTSYENIKDKFGKLLTSRSFKGLVLYVHRDAKTGVREHQIGVDKDGKVAFVRIPISYDEALPFSSYKERLELDEPDIIKYDKNGFYEKAHIYLDEGVWFNVFDTTQVVYQESYFTPMSADEFMQLWGNILEDEYFIPPHYAY